jgi:glycosyltransferase involved in cell wall biosynthesis
MACGLPVIATAVGGNADLVRNRRTGLLVEPNDADMLATAMADLLHDAEYGAALGRAARAEVETQNDIRRTAAVLARRYERLAERTTSERP